MGLPSWVVAIPKNVSLILTYIPNRMGPAAHFWIDPFGTCANLQIYAQWVDIPKALCDVLGDALGRFVLYCAWTLHRLFDTIWVGLTYVSLGFGLVFDFWTVQR